MNLLTFNDALEPGRGSVHVGQAEIGVPAPRAALTRRDLILGVRPEHVRLSDGARLRGEVFRDGISRHHSDRHDNDGAWRGQSAARR